MCMKLYTLFRSLLSHKYVREFLVQDVLYLQQEYFNSDTGNLNGTLIWTQTGHLILKFFQPDQKPHEMYARHTRSVTKVQDLSTLHTTAVPCGSCCNLMTTTKGSRTSHKCSQGPSIQSTCSNPKESRPTSGKCTSKQVRRKERQRRLFLGIHVKGHQGIAPLHEKLMKVATLSPVNPDSRAHNGPEREANRVNGWKEELRYALERRTASDRSSSRMGATLRTPQ